MTLYYIQFLTEFFKKILLKKVFNLANNVDEEEAMKKIAELKAEAKESSKNKHRVRLFFLNP